ncbi:N-acetylmuramic acid 6-phosphate etherase [Micromonospora phaseoli]|uniref:N-acetylmuramic acid 6-phosphate etherase n=1 Tax=Micromonospora phaseoli TaxID=1144548 RepID=A0A1H6WJZ5_9ACTN|nr:N-acetylmuramic acid 6-phosphate etherase [Micromonospora phaseoli]PZW01693.1 N-acetylmuramic acid 6-phosphate etherase [Micromonospora phaseoli]GIJ80821.1 N-acetylmuramic acid 6-phosphate etherase [Micromonospora phaseoli]SEJ13110.1 N-acetylmuramic acid 6-phosphate etherase [Micromonospora phaseoli]
MTAGAVEPHEAPVPTGRRPVVRVGAPTERRNPLSVDLDLMSTRDVLSVINEADRRVPIAAAAVVDEIAEAVDLAVTALRGGHRVHYFGAGTSGRLGVLDAAELAPTFNSPRHWFCAHLAGGPDAMWRAVEDAEDDDGGGAAEAGDCVEPGDVVVGLTASGRTPYVLGALAASRANGASTVLLCANPETPAAPAVDVFIGVDTGPEVVAGSTRMKAGTAQKLVLNGFSTAVMVRLGRVYSNLMIDMVATNAKLRGRMISILVESTGCAEEVARQALDEAGGDLKTALVSLVSGVAATTARAALARSADQVRGALALLAS